MLLILEQMLFEITEQQSMKVLVILMLQYGKKPKRRVI
jgi:hypothetical protein